MTVQNPYNFVSLGDKVERKEYKKQKGLTGNIECNIKTLTPIFIPNTSNDNYFGILSSDGHNDEVKSYDFYSYDDLKNDNTKAFHEPVIPGSEIRGMIRSVYETITNSCLSSINNDIRPFRRIGRPANPGILYYNKEEAKWKMKKCRRLAINAGYRHNSDNNGPFPVNRYLEGQELFVKQDQEGYVKTIKTTGKRFKAFDVASDIQTSELPGYEKGYYHKGEIFSRKHHESVFIPENSELNVSSKSIENLLISFEIYEDKKVKMASHHNHYNHIDKEKIKNKEGIALVYYRHLENDDYYLSPAMIGREVFFNRISDILGQHNPCGEITEICPACSLFGFTGDKSALSSRIRFSDATVSKTKNSLSEYYDDDVTIPELAGPKPQCAEFYLKRPDNSTDWWNYDYKVTWPNDKSAPVLKAYSAEIKGRKYYWHAKIETSPAQQGQVTKRNVHIRPLKKNNELKCKIFFNNITNEELSLLIWSLTLANRDKNAHKIGMGKPVGLGSIQISVNKIRLRNIINGYNIEEQTDPNEYVKTAYDLIDNKIKDEILKITDFQNADNSLSYPSIPGKNESFHWFVENKKRKNDAIRKPSISEELIGLINQESTDKSYKKSVNDKKSVANRVKKFKKGNF